MYSPGTTTSPPPSRVVWSSRYAALAIESAGRTTVRSAKPLSLTLLSPADVAVSTSVSTVPAATLPIEYTTSTACEPAAATVIEVELPATPFTETTVIAEPG